jgi:hypothetical protein
MSKNKKILTVLSTAAITGLMVATINSTVFAKATKIAINSNDGKVYVYQYDVLKASAVSQLLNGTTDPGAKLYNDFLQRKTSVRAYYDDVRNSYVEFDTISKEAVNSVLKGISFDLNSFMESTTTPTTTITTNPVSVDASGNLVVNGQTIAVYDETSVRDNTIKTYYNGDDLKVDVQFTRGIDSINASDFSLGGVTATGAYRNGDMVTLTFKDGAPATASEIAAYPITYANGKTNISPTKIDIIKAQGQTAKLAINPTGTTDETGTNVSSVLSKDQATIYDYEAGPRTSSDYWSATKDLTGVTVYITFDTPLDMSSGLKSDDFVFTANDGTDLEADLATITGNTVIFKFNTTNKNYKKFTDSLSAKCKSTISLRTIKDIDGNCANYMPSSDDLNRKIIKIN